MDAENMMVPQTPRDEYPENVAAEIFVVSGGALDGVTISIVYNDLLRDVSPADRARMTSILGYRMGHWCGYARFPVKPVGVPISGTLPKIGEMEGWNSGYGGILTYVPVHGGITYAGVSPVDGSVVYGFDCGHYEDETKPNLRDKIWLKQEAARMAIAIYMAKQFEDEYDAADGDDKKRADILDRYHESLRGAGIEFSLADNFGAMLNVLFGGL
jgi:hypothetical protein